MGFNEKFLEKLNKIQLNVNDEVLNKFWVYMTNLLEWNEKINLTAITDEDDMILKHFIDSLTILEYIPEKSNVIDVGTGAGFPGIPLKIVREDINMTLMDSLNKRITFLNEIINKLGLKKINAIHSRAEELAKIAEHREKYDIAVSRAVANLSTLSEYMLPFVKVGGKCICMKGSNIEEELKTAKNAIKELGGEIEKVINFKLPDSDNERNIIIIKKVRNTKSKYPRKAGMPSKEPLK